MFADSDIEFSYEEFQNGVIRENANTREKLVRMDDSVRRAVDYYFQYCGNITQTTTKFLKSSGTPAVYTNEILTSAIVGFGYPVRIDIVQDAENGIVGINNVSFNFDFVTKDVLFTDNDFVTYYESVIDHLTFRIYYKKALDNSPDASNELTYDLNLLGIPEDVQRQIPLYVKGELYEEDESSLSSSSKAQFFQFLITQQREHGMKIQTKVRIKYKRSE
jgi:hypothetical protein